MHSDSRYLTTFITQYGLWRNFKLNFGIRCASEIFQQTIADLLVGKSGVVKVVDDVLIHADTEEEHDKQLLLTLQRFYDAGVMLNEKGEYNVKKIAN